MWPRRRLLPGVAVERPLHRRLNQSRNQILRAKVRLAGAVALRPSPSQKSLYLNQRQRRKSKLRRLQLRRSRHPRTEKPALRIVLGQLQHLLRQLVQLRHRRILRFHSQVPIAPSAPIRASVNGRSPSFRARRVRDRSRPALLTRLHVPLLQPRPAPAPHLRVAKSAVRAEATIVARGAARKESAE